jgi:hypothetical protein
MGNTKGGIMRQDKITTHAFNIAEAVEHGVEKAILLYNIRFWLEKNKANETNARDGYYWTYNSSTAFARLFPYLSEQSIRRWMAELEKKGVLLSSQKYNKSSFDKTKWYTIPSEYTVAQDKQPVAQNEQSVVQNERTIPDVNSDINSNTNTYTAPEGQGNENVELNVDAVGLMAARRKGDNVDNDSFETAWAAYGRKGTKEAALRYWKKIPQADREAITKAIPLYLKTVSERMFQKNFEGWINPANRMWDQDWAALVPNKQAPTQVVGRTMKGW